LTKYKKERCFSKAENGQPVLYFSWIHYQPQENLFNAWVKRKKGKITAFRRFPHLYLKEGGGGGRLTSFWSTTLAEKGEALSPRAKREEGRIFCSEELMARHQGDVRKKGLYVASGGHA